MLEVNAPVPPVSAPVNPDVVKASTPTQHFVDFDPQAPPPTGFDCFGRWFMRGDIACDGDPSMPGDTGCICKAECEIRTAATLKSIQSSVSGGANTGTVAITAKSYSLDDLKFLQAPSVVVEPIKNGSMLSLIWKKEGKTLMLISLGGKSNRQKIFVYSKAAFEGSKWVDYGGVNQWHHQVGSSDEMFPKLQAIFDLNLK